VADHNSGHTRPWPGAASAMTALRVGGQDGPPTKAIASVEPDTEETRLKDNQA